MRLTISIDEGTAAAAVIRDWLIAAGYLPDDEIEEDTPTEGEA